METKNKGSAESKKWGMSAAEFYAGLRDKPVQIVTLDGKIYKGQLVGVDQYDLLLKQAKGIVILIAKHAIKFVQADVPVNDQVS